jgi:hypothetical protein
VSSVSLLDWAFIVWRGPQGAQTVYNVVFLSILQDEHLSIILVLGQYQEGIRRVFISIA